MILSTAGYLLLAWGCQAIWGNHGLFIALTGFMLLRGATLQYHYPAVVRAAGAGRDST